MMRHLKNQTLSLYLDKRGSDAARLKAKQHIDECPLCQQRLDEMNRMSSALRGLSDLDISSSYDFEFRRRLAEAEKSRLSYPLRAKEPPIKVLEGLEELISRIAVPRLVPVVAKVAVAVIVALMIIGPTMYYLQPASPRIILAKGFAVAYNTRVNEWVTVDAGMRLGKNTAIKTDESGIIDIAVAGKYKIRLDGKSQLVVTDLIGNRRDQTASFLLEKGVLLAETEQGFAGSELHVQTPNAEATVTGTRFMVEVVNEELSNLAVLDGEVAFSRFSEDEVAEGTRTVSGGFQSTVRYGQNPTAPEKLSVPNSEKLLDMFTIGIPGRIAPSQAAAENIKSTNMVFVLVMSDEGDRTEWFLRRGLIWTNDKEPKPVNRLLKDVNKYRRRGEIYRSRKEHLKAIEKLERIVTSYPDHKYNPQVLMLAGAYYVVVDDYDRAFQKFREVTSKYGDTEIAPIAQYAAGLIYEKNLGNEMQAYEAYNRVTSRYPDSPEAEFAKKRLIKLGIK